MPEPTARLEQLRAEGLAAVEAAGTVAQVDEAHTVDRGPAGGPARRGR